MAVTRARLISVLCALSASGCAELRDDTRAVMTDAAILQAEVRDDWQEGPTDGTVCLDPRVLTDENTGALGASRWAPAVLSALQMDTLVAIDTTVGAMYLDGARACAPRGGKPSIRMGVPSVRGDSAELAVYAYWPATTDDAGWRFPLSVVLARRSGRWVVVRHPGEEFPVQPDAR